MELRPGYKQTEVGVIPAEWDIQLLDLICDVRDGTHESPRFFKHGVPFITSKNIVDGHLDLENVSYISESDAVDFNRRSKVDRFDILMSMIGTIGSAVLVNCEPNFCIKNVALIKPRKVVPDFLIQLINSAHFQRYLEDNLDGGIQKFVSLGTLRQLSIPLPRESEQCTIAAALSDVDAMIGGLDQLIAKKRDIKQATMQRLLTGKQRLPGFSGEWETKRLGDICGKVTTGKLDANAMVENGEYPFFTCASEHYWINKYAFDTEALLVSGNGANVGYIHHYKGKFNAYQRTYVLTDFSEEIGFIKLFMDRNLQQRIRTEVNAGNTPYIKMDTLTEMSVVIPKNMAEQTAIATVLSDMDAEIAALEQKRDKTLALKQGMMQELLTGRIRLV